MSDERLNRIVDRLISSSDPQEVRQLYKQWSTSYDEDLESFGYVAPAIATSMFARIVDDKQSKIHDAGCGTGLVGGLLGDLGYRDIDGSDFSTDMLKKAEMTGCYSDLIEADYSQPLTMPDNCYDAVISIGVYSQRFKQWFIPEMLRIVKPGGYFLFTCRELYYEEVATALIKMQQSTVISASTVAFEEYMTGQNAHAYYIGLTKASV